MRWLVCIVLMVGSAQAETKASAVAKPTLSPKPGKYTPGIFVTLEDTTPGAVIHYTVDDSEPDESSPSYKALHHQNSCDCPRAGTFLEQRYRW